MTPERFILLVSILAAAATFFFPVRKRFEIVQSMPGELEKDQPERRIVRFILEVCLQSKVILQRPFAGIAHAFVFWGFMAFGLVTLDHFCRGGFGFPVLGHGIIYDVLRGGGVLFALITMGGINYLAYRRFVERPKVLGDHLSITSGVVAVFINVLMITYLLDYLVFDCLMHDEGTIAFAEGSIASTINWWIHALVILAFLCLIPRSKHLHLVLGPFTTYFKSFDLAPVKALDFEKEEFGAESLKDLGKFTGLSAFSCVECGRCFEHCPASQTDKQLNPKEMILDMKKGLLEDPGTGVDEALDLEAIWQCTTCGSCTFQCPVGVEHVTPMIETRRGLVAGGVFPSPLKTAFKSLERHQNPWGYTQDQAEEFLEENSYPKFKDQEVLYWMGCLARYDDHYRKASVAFKEKLDDAKVSWGVLYNEICTGDAARRAGNEFVFQEIAATNIEMLNEAAPKRIVTTCPHCLRTLKEYRELGLSPDIELIHHSTFLKELVEKKKLGGADKPLKNAVYHDACYLSRYGGMAGRSEPRAFLRSQNVAVAEPRRTKERSFCCGAGGGQFFNEETEGKRINLERIDEILETPTSLVITSCPFCQAMLRDALADRGVEDVEVKDLSQI